MRGLLRAVAWIVLLGLVALAAFILVPEQRTPPQTNPLAAGWQPAADAPLYAARLADCAACHTAEGGKPFAGGRPIQSPFGPIYATNITPDPETGIGGMTLDEFRAVLYDGIGRKGENLYPAMPYANYRTLTEADVQSLYAYFMHQVLPVRNEVPRTALAFPFNQRWGIRAWKWVGLPAAGFTPRFNDPKLDRGAYLVEGPGHCGACHSPRNAFFAQDGYTSKDPSFLSGGLVGGWTAPDLRTVGNAIAGWSAQDLDLFLATGRNAHAGVTGEMELAIAHSLQYMSAEDRAAMVAYLRAIGPAPGTPPSAPKRVVARAATFGGPDATATEKLLASADPAMPLGARLYLDNCGACHFVDGKGADGIFPALDGNALVTAPGTAGLITTILKGAALPSTALRPYAVAMPGFAGRLSDEEVAALATFVRGAWHNRAGAIAPADVRAIRGAAGGGLDASSLY